MKKCALCEINDADKKNTHYLTDNVIRKTLNKNGSGERGYGSFCELSTMSPFIKYGFQQNVSIDVITNNLRREPNEEEIINAKNNIAYSVDNVFCSDCENKFSRIETAFNENVLNKLRQNNPKPGCMQFKEIEIIRRYCFLQFWRSHICNPNFKLNEDFATLLKKTILEETINTEELTNIPLSVSYLITPSDDEHTENHVGFCFQENPVIFMDEFVLQLYNSGENVIFDSLFGVYEKETYKKYINYKENTFAVQIIDNGKRKSINQAFNNWYAESVNKQLISVFCNEFKRRYGAYPSLRRIQLFESKISSRSSFYMNMYSEEEMTKLINECCNI